MNPSKRTRLSPEDRRQQLLDSARSVILERGLSQFTMESLAKAAGVSNPLVYKYFDTRVGLFSALLLRESKQLEVKLADRMAGVSDFQSFISTVVSVNFEQVPANNIIQVLRTQPDVEEVVTAVNKKRRTATAKYLMQELMRYLAIDQEQAEQVLLLASGASRASAAHFHRFGGDKAKMIERAVCFIQSGTEALLRDT